MKDLMININKKDSTDKKTNNITEIRFSSDWFKCRNCGYTVRKKVLGNIAHCSECGGTMDRC